MILHLRKRGSILSPKDITKLCRDFGVNLDNSYKEFLMKTNGGVDWYATSYVEDARNIIWIQGRYPAETGILEMFGIDIGLWDIREWTEKTVNMGHSLAIASTTDNGLILFIDSSEDRGYYFFNFIRDPLEMKNLHFIAKTFDEFQEKIVNPETDQE